MWHARDGGLNGHLWKIPEPGLGVERFVSNGSHGSGQRQNARIADAERAIVNRAKELFQASGDHIQEEEALDDAIYALRALKNCLEIHGGLSMAA